MKFVRWMTLIIGYLICLYGTSAKIAKIYGNEQGFAVLFLGMALMFLCMVYKEF